MKLEAISQPKQSESVTCLQNADLKLIIANNEKGKLAQEKVPLLNKKIKILDSTVTLLNLKLSIKQETIDTLYSTSKKNEEIFRQVISNDKLIQDNSEESIKLLQRQIKKAKTKTFLTGTIGLLLLGLTFYLK